MSSKNMTEKRIKTATKFQVLLTIIVLLSTFVLVAGTAWARYESKLSLDLEMDVQLSKQIYLLSDKLTNNGTYEVLSDWTSSKSGEYNLDFLLANGIGKDNVCAYDQVASIEIVATAGVEKPENIQLVLSVGANNYTAVATEIEKDSSLYTMYGPGWIYKFYNKAGEELSWKLIGGKFNYQKMSIKVTGSSEYPIGLSLIAKSSQSLQ